MTRPTALLLVSLALAMPGAGASADVTAEEAALLAASCSGCHRADSDSSHGIPSLSGRSSDKLLSLMLAYRDGQSDGTLMPRLAAGYSDDELEAIADFLAGQ